MKNLLSYRNRTVFLKDIGEYDDGQTGDDIKVATMRFYGKNDRAVVKLSKWAEAHLSDSGKLDVREFAFSEYRKTVKS